MVSSTKENYKKDLKHLKAYHHRDLDRISKREANALYKAIRECVCERRGKDRKTDLTTGVVTAASAMRLARILFRRVRRYAPSSWPPPASASLIKSSQGHFTVENRRYSSS